MGTDRPTGIYAFMDEYAVVLLGALTRLGIRVPQEVALVTGPLLSEETELLWLLDFTLVGQLEHLLERCRFPHRLHGGLGSTEFPLAANQDVFPAHDDRPST